MEAKIIQQEFNSVTPENAMKFESTQPSRNNFTFAEGDKVAEFAKKNKLQVHCHTLVWHSQLPVWVSQGGFDNATLISIMENHIKTVAGRYKSVCTRWDVVNEGMLRWSLASTKNLGANNLQLWKRTELTERAYGSTRSARLTSPLHSGLLPSTRRDQSYTVSART